MQSNLFASIVENNKRVQNAIASGSSGSSSTYSFDSYQSSTTNTSANTAVSTSAPASSASNTESDMAPYHDLLVPYAFSIADVRKVTDATLLSSTTHIEYVISFTNLKNNEISFSIAKRFKELANFYNELCLHDQIKDYHGLEFPSPSESWFTGGDRYDPQSSFIQKRRHDLQVFFHKLFDQNIYLHIHPYTIDFFSIPKNVLGNNNVSSSSKNQVTVKATTAAKTKQTWEI
jgi:hypothetical protein